MMDNYEVFLTFKTDKVTSEILKLVAHKIGKTQPELINEICKDFVQMLDDIAKEKLENQQ